jgi:hypothetical protein
MLVFFPLMKIERLMTADFMLQSLWREDRLPLFPDHVAEWARQGSFAHSQSWD